MQAATRYQAGLAAEEIVARSYEGDGLTIAARRWRGPGGEIDLILRDGSALVFVEVKKSRDFARAADRVTARQLDRIGASALAFVAGEPKGQETEMRLDVALVDGAGRIERLENVMAA